MLLSEIVDALGGYSSDSTAGSSCLPHTSTSGQSGSTIRLRNSLGLCLIVHQPLGATSNASKFTQMRIISLLPSAKTAMLKRACTAQLRNGKARLVAMAIIVV